MKIVIIATVILACLYLGVSLTLAGKALTAHDRALEKELALIEKFGR